MACGAHGAHVHPASGHPPREIGQPLVKALGLRRADDQDSPSLQHPAARLQETPGPPDVLDNLVAVYQVPRSHFIQGLDHPFAELDAGIQFPRSPDSMMRNVQPAHLHPKRSRRRACVAESTPHVQALQAGQAAGVLLDPTEYGACLPSKSRRIHLMQSRELVWGFGEHPGGLDADVGPYEVAPQAASDRHIPVYLPKARGAHVSIAADIARPLEAVDAHRGFRRRPRLALCCHSRTGPPRPQIFASRARSPAWPCILPASHRGHLRPPG